MAQTVALNRKARHNFTITDTFEAGIVLTGTEIKSVRGGKVNLSDAYARVEKGQAWLMGAHIAPFEHGNRYNHEPRRDRKLLLHRKEIEELERTTRERGLTVIPTKVYLKGGLIKCELAVGRGKKLHDKRASEREREADAEARAAVGRRGRE